MNLLLNLLWAILGGGLITALEYVLAGLVCCLSVVGLPFGLQCFKIAGLALAPFGKDFEDSGADALGLLGNVVWILFAGVWIFVSHIALAISLAVTIIGLPFAYQHVKLAMMALAPFGVVVRPAE
ncbi:MAG: YccF domain-containing protein [Methylococcus sp.]